ncbi:MAG TPA: matrixin family metalloprotease [Terriglobia bacterium]|nr:matrixin family metalloprotease [Terriglobia bacterium]
MSRKRLLLLAVASLGVFSAAGLLATNFQIYEVTAGNYVAAMWPTVSPATAPNVTWNLNFASTPSNVNENGSGVAPKTILSDAFATWATATYNNSTVTNIEFTFGTANATLPRAPAVDCQNVIGFADPTSSDFPTGVIAFASIATVNSAGGPVPFAYNCGSISPNPSCPLDVCIVDVDIMFNPSDTFATSGATTGQYDLQSVATHEIGHLMGLDHSTIAHAVMYPYGDTSSIGIRQQLWTDDMIGAGKLYPGPAVTANGTGIQGQVTVGGTGAYAAHVEAIDATTGDVVTDTLTDPSGNYHLRMFGGTYYVYVQSLAPDLNRGPCTIANFRGQDGYGPPANPTDYTGEYY